MLCAIIENDLDWWKWFSYQPQKNNIFYVLLMVIY